MSPPSLRELRLPVLPTSIPAGVGCSPAVVLPRGPQDQSRATSEFLPIVGPTEGIPRPRPAEKSGSLIRPPPGRFTLLRKENPDLEFGKEHPIPGDSTLPAGFSILSAI